MKRKAPQAPRWRSRPPPRPQPADAGPEGPTHAPAPPGVEQVQPHAPAGTSSTDRTSIERADEHRLGSIEAIPAPALEDHIAGFVEPAGDEGADAALPPGLPAQ